MERPNRLNYLYCVNINCHASIYHRMMIRIPSNEENHCANNRCSFCNRMLISDDEILVIYMIATVNNQKTARISLHN